MDILMLCLNELYISPQCGSKFSKDDVITLNGSDEDVERLQQRMRARKEQAKLAKVTGK
jgi:hypothetical protein